MNLQATLLSKGLIDQLPHFYIVESTRPQGASQKFLFEFIKSFIQRYYETVEEQERSIGVQNHPDVFLLGNLPDAEAPEHKAFTVEEAAELNRFFEWKAVLSKRKFAVITEGHRVNQIVANKWLKLLEEPIGKSTIFLLNPRGQGLLPTIQSRGILLRVPEEREARDTTQWFEFLTAVRGSSLSGFLDQYSKGEVELGQWIDELVSWEATNSDGFKSKEALTKLLKQLHVWETFNQPTATKWSLFYYYLVTEVLPRLSR